MRAPRLAVVCLFAGLGLHAQIPGSAPATGTSPPLANGVVIGQAVDGRTGTPVAGSVVMLAPAPGGLGSLGPGDAIPMDQLRSVNVSSVLAGVRQAITDGQGRFAFTGLPRGTFSLAATKAGWSGGGYGQRRPDGSTMPFVLEGDGRVGNVVLQFWKTAAIGGTVVDEAGEPIVGIAVRALRRTWLAGRPRYASSGAAQTDDRGVYRISGLRPGDYVVAIAQTPSTAPASGAPRAMDPSAIQNMILASGPGGDPNAMLANLGALVSGGTSSGGIRVGEWVLLTSTIGSRLIPPALSESGRLSAYRTTFYPSVFGVSQAAVVPIGSGEDHPGVDFQLRPVPVAQVSGTVAGPDGPLGNVALRLIAAGGDDLASDSGFESATSTSSPNGAFAFLAVPPGQYTVRVVRTPQPGTPSPAAAALSAGMSSIQNAQGNRAISMGQMTMDMMMPTAPTTPAEPTLWASVPVTVGGDDVTGLGVALRTGYHVSGRAEFEGTAPRPTADQLKRIPIVLDRADIGTAIPSPLVGLNQSAAGVLDENAQFTTSGAIPGRYLIRAPLTFGGWTLKSAMLAGRDLSDDPLEIENNDVSGVALTFTDRTTEVAGLVRDTQGRPASSGSVVTFSVRPDHWVDFGSSPRRLRVARVAPDGRYRVTGMAAGEYFIAAIAGDVAGDWQDPSYLEGLSRRAIRIDIGDSEKKALDLVIR